MTMISSALAVLLTALPVPAAAAGPAEPPADKVVIDIVTASGTGCQPGTMAVSVSPDNTGFQIDFGDFTATAGGGTPATEARKSCALNLRVHAPAGYTYALSSSEYRGYAHVETGATATLRSQYYFSGNATNPYAYYVWGGPFDGDWQATNVVEPTQLVYAECGTQPNLNLSTELRVIAGTAAELPSLIQLQGQANFQFSWQVC